MKHVEYFGVTYQVPDETVSIATDRDGKIDCYSDVPVTVYAVWIGNRIAKLGRRTIVEPHWKESLMLVGDVKCEYCGDGVKPMYSEWDAIVYIENHLLWFKNADNICLPIHYCPMCGKKLEVVDDNQP